MRITCASWSSHSGTAKVLEWDKELFSYGGRPKLHAQLGKVDFDQAMTATRVVSGELSVNECNSAKAELQLEALAKSFHVDTTAIRKQVAAESTLNSSGKYKSTQFKKVAPFVRDCLALVVSNDAQQATAAVSAGVGSTSSINVDLLHSAVTLIAESPILREFFST